MPMPDVLSKYKSKWEVMERDCQWVESLKVLYNILLESNLFKYPLRDYSKLWTLDWEVVHLIKKVNIFRLNGA